MGPFLLESLRYDQGLVFLRAALGRGRLTPLEGLPIEIGEVYVLALREEARAEILNGACDATLLVAACHGHRSRLEAVVPCQFEQRRIETDRVALALEY